MFVKVGGINPPVDLAKSWGKKLLDDGLSVQTYSLRD